MADGKTWFSLPWTAFPQFGHWKPELLRPSELVFAPTTLVSRPHLWPRWISKLNSVSPNQHTHGRWEIMAFIAFDGLPTIWPLETRVVEAIGARFCSNNSGFQAPFVAKVGFQTKFSFSTSTHPWQMGNHGFHCLGQPFPNFAAGKLSCFYENWGKLFPNFIFRRSVCRASLRQKAKRPQQQLLINLWRRMTDHGM